MSIKPNQKPPKQTSKTKRITLSVDEKRLKKLEGIKTKLEQGKHVQNRDLQTWLTKDEFESIDFWWERELERRELKYENKPDEVRHYEKLLQKAKFADNKAERFNGNYQKSIKMRYAAESLYERALEYLSEQYSINPQIQFWFDRDIVNSNNDNPHLSADSHSVPYVLTSRSPNNEGRMYKSSIADTKLFVVKTAIQNIKNPSVETKGENVRSKKLQELLKMHDDPDF